MNWQTILLSAAGFILGISVVANYAIKLRSLLREGAEVLIAVDDLLMDGKVTPEEVTRLKKEALDVWVAVKAFAKK